MLPVCYPSSPSPVTGLPEAVAYALSSTSGLTRWVDYIPVKLVGSPLGLNEQTTNLNGFVPMRLLGSAIGMAAWSDYIPVYVDNSATEAWVTSATGYIPYANSVAGATTPSFYLNLSNASNATILDGEGRGTITSVRDSVIASSISVSRTSGAAPLYVNFDYTATTSSGSTNPTHECFFATDFGDSGAGTWANGVQSSGLTSKNAGYGPVTGHVYETPGTYNVTMVVTDGVNTSSRTAQITVQDPNTVYAGALTICISHSNNFTGAPSGATQVNTAGNTDMYAAFNTYKASNKRILFCKADSWTVSASIQFTSITGMTVGGYGTGVARAFGSGTLVNVDASTWSTGSIFVTNAWCSDIRLCDMKVLGSGQSLSGISMLNTITQFTASKMEFRGTTGGFNAYPGGGGTNNVFDQLCIYECVVDDLFGYSSVDTPRAVVTTTNGSSDIAATAHPFVVGRAVQFPATGTTQFPIAGTAPSPLAISTTYFVSSDGFGANSFRLTTTLAHAQAGTNTQTLTTSGTYTLNSNSLGGGIGAFVGLVRGGMMGCYIDACNNGEQTVRFPFLDRAHITNNYIARPNQGKNVVKIHGFVYNEVALYSEKFVFSGNEIDMRGGYSNGVAIPGSGGVLATQVGDTSILASNGGSLGDERVRNGIIENNITRACEGWPRSSLLFISIGCPTMTVRNNIADFAIGDRTASYTSAYGNTFLSFAQINVSTNDPTVDVNVYNNTMYSNMYNAENHTFVYFNGIGSGVTSTWAAGTPGVFTATAHKLYVGFRVRVSGTVPPELTVGTFYWVTATNHTANTFTLSATEGGAALTLSGSGSCSVNQFVDVDNVKVQNNIWYNPHHNLANTNCGVKRNIGTPTASPTNVTTDHNTDNNGNITTSPGFVNTPPVLLTDWRPTAAWTIDNGATVPVLSDFNQATRVGGTYDLGAVLP